MYCFCWIAIAYMYNTNVMLYVVLVDKVSWLGFIAYRYLSVV